VERFRECDIRCIPRNLNPLFSIFIAQDFDLFRDIHVQCESGVFYAQRCFLDKSEMQFGENGNGSKLVFVTLEAVFSPIACQRATFWNAPVLNFLMDLRPASEGSTSLHVSRLFPPLDELSGEEDIEPSKRCRRYTVSFPFSKKPAVIEHLPHYEEAKRKLSSGEVSLVATPSSRARFQRPPI
jgi:hypothetical protein